LFFCRLYWSFWIVWMNCNICLFEEIQEIFIFLTIRTLGSCYRRFSIERWYHVVKTFPIFLGEKWRSVKGLLVVLEKQYSLRWGWIANDFLDCLYRVTIINPHRNFDVHFWDPQPTMSSWCVETCQISMIRPRDKRRA